MSRTKTQEVLTLIVEELREQRELINTVHKFQQSVYARVLEYILNNEADSYKIHNKLIPNLRAEISETKQILDTHVHNTNERLALQDEQIQKLWERFRQAG